MVPFLCSDINSITDNKITKPNQLLLNDYCYYYAYSFTDICTVYGGIEVSLEGYIVNPQTNNIEPQLQSSVKIDPIK